MSAPLAICSKCHGLAPPPADDAATRCPYWNCAIEGSFAETKPLSAWGAVRYELLIPSPGGDRIVVLEDRHYIIGSDSQRASILITASGVEAEHALLTFAEDVWRLRPLSAVRRGEQVIEEEAVLQAGDVLWFGRAPAQFRAVSLDTSPAAEEEEERRARTIWFSKRGVRVGSGADCDVILAGLNSLHARIAPMKDHWLLIDEAGLGDVRVNRRSVVETKLAKGELVELGPYSFTCIDHGLKPYRGPVGYELKAGNLSYRAPNGRLLLDGISFVIQPNEFVGIVGASGSGKSTLLKLLAGYHPLPDEAGASLAYDGLPMEEVREEFRQAMGYVPQDDILHHNLTVGQALGYYAELRLGLRGEERQARVDEALNKVQLTERSNSPIHQLSGGQRKRVNVAAELVGRPRVLFMDEPTSGLDPGGETDLMHQFRSMANLNQTIVCATHVMENADLFDKIIVLRPSGASGPGLLDFFGSPSELRRHYNIERLVDLYRRIDPTLHASGQKLDDRPAKRSLTQLLSDGLRALAAPVRTASRLIDLLLAWAWRTPQETGGRMATARFQSVAEGADSGSGFGLFWRQLRVLALRYANILSADRQYLWLLVLLQPLLLGLMLAISVPADFKESSRDLMLFLGAVAAIWLGLNCAIREIVRERDVLQRERQAGLQLPAYLVSKIMVLGLVGVIQCSIMAGVVSSRPEIDREEFRREALHNKEYDEALPRHLNWSRALQQGFPTPREFKADEWARNFSGFWLCFFAAMSVGLAVSAIVRSGEAAVAFLPLLTIPQILFSRIIIGFGKTANFADDWINLPNFPELLACFSRGDTFSILGALLARLTPSHYGFECLRAMTAVSKAIAENESAPWGDVFFYAFALLVIAALGFLAALAALRLREEER